MKTLFVDIETAPNYGWFWRTGEQVVSYDQIAQDAYLLCWAAKWLGQSKIYSDSLRRHKLHKINPIDDKHIAQSAHKLLNEADVVVAHNGDSFDVKWLNTVFLKHSLGPVAPYKTVDTYKVAKAQFYFQSNKLDYISKWLKAGEKMKHEGFGLWKKCMAGDMEAWNRMEKYNARDVRILEKVYMRMRPYHKTHPSAALYRTSEELACRVCASSEVERRGYERLAGGSYPRFQCKSCGAWNRGRQKVKAVGGV